VYLINVKKALVIFYTDFIVWFISIETNWNMIYSGQHHLTTAVTENQDAAVAVILFCC